MTYYVPGLGEKDQDKVIRSLMQVHENTATNTDDIATKVTGPASATDNALARFDATTGKLVQNSEVTLGDSDGKLTRAAGISFSGTNTNDAAAAGYVGEFISNTGSASLTTDTPANVGQITLTAGDWDITGAVSFGGAGATITTDTRCSINTVSATLNTTIGQYFDFRDGGGITDFIFYPAVGPLRVSITSNTTYYLVAQATFTVSTFGATGLIRARRVR